jgi:hypothetical protein
LEVNGKPRTREWVIKNLIRPIAKGLGLTFESDAFSFDIIARCSGTGKECRVTYEDIEDNQWDKIKEKFLSVTRDG